MKRGQGKIGLERDLERFLEYLCSERGFPLYASKPAMCPLPHPFQAVNPLFPLLYPASP